LFAEKSRRIVLKAALFAAALMADGDCADGGDENAISVAANREAAISAAAIGEAEKGQASERRLARAPNRPLAGCERLGFCLVVILLPIATKCERQATSCNHLKRHKLQKR
jgi:hypothetical protein